MSSSMSHAASTEPNLTPMLDMVFQLITFFMLVINLKGAEMDRSVNLPVVGSARPLNTGGEEGLLVLNVSQDGTLQVYGQQASLDSYLAQMAQASLRAARESNPKFDASRGLPEMVVIRADRDMRVAALTKIVKACQSSGYRRFALRALNEGGR